jgi:hypothetical protein
VALEPAVAGYGDRTGTGGLVVFLGDGAAEQWRDAEDGEVAAGDQIDMRGLIGCSGDGGLNAELDTVDGGNAGKRLLFLDEFPEEGIGEESPASVGQGAGAAGGPAVTEEDQLVGIQHRERAQQDGIEQSEYSGVGSDAEGKREQSYEGKAGAFGEGAGAEAQVGD